MRLLNSEEMKQVEQYTAKFGLSYQRMMENAGVACARNIRNEMQKAGTAGKNVAIVCGKGNNGGDGFVVARKLAENGYNVCVIMAMGYPTSQEATYMYKLVIDMGLSVVWYEADKAKAIQTVRSAHAVVDAVFGFSFYGTMGEELGLLLKEMSSCDGMKFAIDVPSGVYCDSGFHAENCFRADFTIAISSLKPAHIVHPACDCCGDIIIANIGIPEESYQLVKDSLYTYNRIEVGNLFHDRPSVAHKGTFGHVLIISGSKGMVGAPVLAAGAALRSGAGLVTVAFPESVYVPISVKLTEALLMPLPETEGGTLSKEAIPLILGNLDRYSTIVIGPGLGVNDDTAEVMKAVIENSKVPVVVDADGINVIAKSISILESKSCDIILTPHLGEMSRLCGVKTELIGSDTVGYARKFAQEHKVYLALKCANTVVASPESDRAYVNSSGNNSLSKGGSGDVLAGLMGGFLALGMPCENAATAAVYIHGYTAEVLSEKTSKSGMLPSDLVYELRYSMSAFEK